MRLHSYRRGFATNSSSAHDVIVIKNGSEGLFHDELLDGGNFGWQPFTAVSDAAKRDYLATTLWCSLAKLFPGMDHAAYEALVRTYISASLPRDGSIDHQSMMEIPRTHRGGMPDREFFQALSERVLAKNVAILGGNDNDADYGEGDDEQYPIAHPLHQEGTVPPWYRLIPQDAGSSKLVCRGNGTGYDWTLLDQRNGTKVRMSFDDDSTPPTCSGIPELVDVKITDYCDHGCSFCYQGSTPAGKHADKRLLTALAYTLSEMGVLEVAIGGGDPLAHPDLADFMATLRRHDVVPNLTVRELVIEPKLRAEILKHVGAIGVSVHSLQDAVQTVAQAKEYGLHPSYTSAAPKYALQHVLGLLDFEETCELVKFCASNGAELTLLGWKGRGRAEPKPPHDIDFVKLVKVTGVGRIGVDACIVDQYRERLLALAHRQTWEDAREGAFSMYIDAVEMKLAPSSYSAIGKDLKATDYWTDLDNQILSAYHAFQEELNIR